MSTPPPSYPQQPAAQYPTQPQAQAPGQPGFAPQAPGVSSYGQQSSAPLPSYATAKPVPVNTTVGELNAYALISIIITFMVPLAGIIFGHLALGQIKRTGDAGRGLAMTAVVYGYVVFGFGILFAVTYVGFIAVMIGSLASLGTGY